MNIKPLKLNGAYELNFNKTGDRRGYFMRFYDRRIFAEHGLQTDWEQESLSLNQARDTVRGLHFQMPPFAETKIVRVAQGAILDALVDLRKDSATYGEWEAVELTAENAKALYIPKGFAHGFRTLAENTIVEYKIDVPYQSGLANGIFWNDADLKINWRIENPILSERDAKLPKFSVFDSPF